MADEEFSTGGHEGCFWEAGGAGGIDETAEGFEGEVGAARLRDGVGISG